MTTTITRLPRTSIVNRVNHYRNPSFETAQLPTQHIGLSALEFSTAWAAGGTRSVLATPSGTGQAGWRMPDAERPATAQGASWVAAATMRNAAASPTQDVSLLLRFYDAAGATVGTQTHTLSLAAASTGFFAVGGVAPAGTATVGVIALRPAGVAGAGWYSDSILLATSGSYFNGDTAPSGPYTYAWEGTSGASRSFELIDNPADVVTPMLLLGYETSRGTGNIVHDVIGASAPLVVVGTTKRRRGRLEFLTANAVARQELINLLTAANKWRLDDPEQSYVGMFFTLGEGEIGVRLDPATRLRWIISVPYVEVLA